MPFSGNPLDRASELRADPAWVAAQRTEARILPLWRLKVLVTGPEGAMTAARVAPGLCDPLAATDAACVFLGLEQGQPLFALDISHTEEDPTAGPLAGSGEFRDLRPAAFVLPDTDTAILGQAKALIDWHQRHRFCPNCGAVTDMADAGYRRVCPRCAAEHFPRTDPVVIMLPVDGDHCLVGHNARFPGPLYSAFAGFVEPGESMEEAVRRELREEVAVEAGAVSYHASQPWPFPSSLMLGCYAQALSRDFTIDSNEISAARWLGKEEALARLTEFSDPEMRLPVTIAIAHYLIKDWASR